MTKALLKVLHVSTHHEPCGIGKFQEKCVEALRTMGGSVNDFYPLSLNKIKVMNSDNRRKELQKIVEASKDYDLVHIQHEFGFFYRDGLGFDELIVALKRNRTPVILTIHTAPELLLAPSQLSSLSVRGFLGYARRRYRNRQTIKYKIKPFSKVDKIVTFNRFTEEQLISLAGVEPQNIFKTMLPVPDAKLERNKKIRQIMNVDDDTIILCTTGFINEYKGFDQAIKALKFLPDNYSLAILGGINPDSGNPSVYDGLTDLILTLGLENRVYISGYIEDDSELAVLMQGCDIALYPYSMQYYKMASSDAINKAISYRLPVVAYPTQSFKEINRAIDGTIMLTQSANYYELVRSIKNLNTEELISKEAEYYSHYNYQETARELLDIYRATVN